MAVQQQHRSRCSDLHVTGVVALRVRATKLSVSRNGGSPSKIHTMANLAPVSVTIVVLKQVSAAIFFADKFMHTFIGSIRISLLLIRDACADAFAHVYI